ncbi:MAG: sigma 54-interacting transcriptional regulator [Thermonemataceae bacterium]
MMIDAEAYLSKILIVENEFVQAEALEELLQEIGFTKIFIALKPAEALVLVQQQSIDLILMDIDLGEEDFTGTQLAKVIRNKFGIPSIFVSSYDTPEFVEEAKIADPYGYVLKPVRKRALNLTLALATYRLKYDKTTLLLAQLKAKTRFNAALLEVSRTITTFQAHPDLLFNVFKKIQEIFPFDNAYLYLINGSQHRKLSPLREKVTVGAHLCSGDGPYENQDTLVQQVLRKPYAQVEEVGKPTLQQRMYAPLKEGTHLMGVISLETQQQDFFQENDLSLFQALVDQVAIAISNAIASREVQQRSLEQAVQLALIQALQVKTAWKDRQESFAKSLQQIIPADLIGFYCEATQINDSLWVFQRVGTEEYRQFSLDDFLSMAQVSKEAFKALLTAKAASSTENEPKGLQKRLFNALGMNSINVLKMAVAATEFYVYFLSKETQAFSSTQAERFKRMAPTLTLALEKSFSDDATRVQNHQLKQEKAYLMEEVKALYNFEEMIGDSPAMQRVFEKIKIVMDTDTTVLILGETGTGKELVARALHNASVRKEQPFVKVNCAALPRELIESELFGHEKGAFTGALTQRIGKFEFAHKGTLFLDEIGELPLALQTKLLRVIQEKTFERLGGNTTIRTNVRIVAATNRDLNKEVMENSFRADLYFRLSVFPIELPPLRSRGEDIIHLANFFLEKYTKKIGKEIHTLDQATQQNLYHYPWPGNVRELAHVIERAVLLAQEGVLTLHLEKPLQKVGQEAATFQPKTMREAEAELIYNTLQYCKGKISGKGGAAALLGVPPSTLEYRMKRAGITKEMVIDKRDY